MNIVRSLFAGTAVVTVLAGLAMFATGLAYVRQLEPTLPSIATVADWQPKVGTTILASDGSVLGVHAKEFRKFVPLKAMPKFVGDAFVSAEDGSFWTHSGINPVAMARAVVSKIKNPDGRIGGASTIPQQVVKNLFLTPERSIDRKIKEALLAMKLVKEFGRERILEIYLNEIYLGEGSYGVAAAALTYFGKDLADLTIPEAAVLAALPQAPSAVNPFKNMARTLERRDYVLNRMFEEGYIDSAALAAYLAEPVVVATGPRKQQTTDYAFRYPEEAIRRSLVSELGSEKVYQNGGDVRTSIVPSLQVAVHARLRAGLVREDRRSGWKGPMATGLSLPVDWNDARLATPAGAEDWQVGVVVETGKDAVLRTRTGDVTVTGESLSWATSRRKAAAILKKGDAVLLGDLGHGVEVVSVPDVQGAAVILDPANGAIRALDGGFSYDQSEFNRATQAKLQTGSVFKSFVYLAALDMGYDATSPILDAPIALDQGAGLGDWRPTSHDASMGLITLRRSLELSRNQSTVRLLYDVGTDAVVDVAKRAGFRVPAQITYSMALGTAETTPLNVAEAYATFANGGHHVAATFSPPDKATAFDPAAKPDFDPVAIAQLSSMLEGVTYAGTAKSVFQGFDKPLAAKTGTTDESRDAWFASYGPRFVLVVWVGRDDHKPLARGSAGATTAGRIARDILEAGADEIDFEPFTLPDNADTVLVDRETGMQDDKGDVVEIVRTGEPDAGN
jgi:penicillin-binding protein 1A